MSRFYFLLIISLLLASGLYVIPAAVRPARSSGQGEVCIALDGSTSCPPAAPLITTPTLFPPQLRVAVFINNSAALNSFDIILLTNSSILKPANAIAGNVLSSASLTVLAKCIGDNTVTGIGCGPRDTKDTLHYALTSTLTGTPATGLLFTAIYNITANTYNSPIGFQTGCSGTSVSGGLCVIISSGAPTPDTETAQAAKFNDLPYFDIQTVFGIGSLTVSKGTFDSSMFLNVTIVNSFSGNVSIVPSVSPSGPVVTVSPTVVKVGPSIPEDCSTTNCSQVNVTVSESVSVGSYVLTFNATSPTSPTLPPNILTIPLTVPPHDFSVTANPNSLQFNASFSSSSIITLSSLANFQGIVNLTLTSASGLNASLASNRLTLHGGGTNSTTVNVNSTIAGTYDLIINGTSNVIINGTPVTLAHVFDLKVTVLDFAMNVPPGALIVPIGTTTPQAVNVQNAPIAVVHNIIVDISKIYIAQVTSVGATGPSTGISVSCPKIGNLTTTSNTGIVDALSCPVTGLQVGNYTVTVTATTPRVTHAITFSVIVQGPDFVINPSATIQPLSVGGSATISALLIRKLGLNSTISLAVNFPSQSNPPTPPTATVNPVTTVLNSTYPNATVLITITASGKAPTGIYSMEFRATAGSTAVTHIITMSIVVSTTTSPDNLEVYSVTSTTQSATVGTSVPITILVRNIGRNTENATVIALAGGLSVAQKNFTNLAPGTNITMTLNWNTNGYSAQSYVIGGQVLHYSIMQSSTPVTLTAANTNPFTSGTAQLAIIAALVIIIAIVSALFLLSRRNKLKSGPPAQN